MANLRASMLVMSVVVAMGAGAFGSLGAASNSAVRSDGFGDLDAPLRPGAEMAGGCTFNFVFRGARHTYIGTAAHCTDEPGPDGEPIVVELAGYGEIGVVVYDSDVAVEGFESADFTLIRLHPEVVADTNPTVLDWGGPTGIAADDDLAIGDLIAVHGFGMGYGSAEQTQAREVVLSGWDKREYVANGPIHWGDSGASLIHVKTGRALGIVSRLHASTTLQPAVSSLVGAMLPYIFAELDAAGFNDVELVLGDA